MDHNPTCSPEASTDERAFPSSNAGAPSAPDSADPPLFIPSLVSPSLNDGLADTERHARRCRNDGWTPDRVAAFIEALAACGVVVDARKRVGLSAQSAYALRNRRAGRAFGLMWDAVLRHRARARLSDELISRAMNGCVEAVQDRDGVVTGERHRYDNRLSMAVLTRLDRLAEAKGEDDTLLRAMSEDLEDYLDCVEDGGDVDAFVEERRPAPPSPAPPPEPATTAGPRARRIEDDWDRMASLIGCLDYKLMNPLDIDLYDLDDCSDRWSIEQWLRAHYSGYNAWKAAGEQDRQTDPDYDEDDEDEDELDSPGAFMRERQAVRDAVAREQARADGRGGATEKPPEIGSANGPPQASSGA